MKEFKDTRGRLSKKHIDHIDTANRYFQAHVERLKTLRNEFGGHLKAGAIEFATSNLPPAVIGRVTWGSWDFEGRLRLELHYANELVAGVISSKLQGASVYDELTNALAAIFDGFIHVQAATYALVHAFLWDSSPW